MRNSFIENQKRHNYNNEYERLIGVLTNKTITHSANRDQLESRVKHLETLGASAVTGLNGIKKKQTYLGRRVLGILPNGNYENVIKF